MGMNQIEPRYIYVVLAEEVGRFKVGWSVDPHARLGALRANSPTHLELIYVQRGTLSQERWIHSALQRYNHFREWFDWNPESTARLIDLLEELEEPD